MNATLEAPVAEPTTPAQIAELELVIDETNTLTVRDEALAEITATLRPIAESIPAALAYAASLKVTNQAEADAAAARREKIIADGTKALEEINGFQDGLINKLHKLHKRWTTFRGLFEPLNTASRQIKQAIITWQTEEEEKARKEERRLQAEAEERARKERERLEAAAAKLKTPEKKEERLEAAAAVVAPVITVARPVAAVKTQKRWRVKSYDLTAMGIPEAVQGYIEVKVSNLERAKAANTMLTIPGVEFHQVLI